MRFFTTIFFLLLTKLMFAQEVTIGSGTTQGQPFPVDPFFGFTYSQVIYPQSSIGYAGNITSLRFYLPSAANISSSNNWTVWIAHTTKTSFTTTTDWVPVSGMTQVFSGIVTNNSGQVVIDISATPFAYNNTDNLILAFDENATGFNSSADRFYVHTGLSNNSIYYRSDGTNPDPTAPPTGTRSAIRPNITLVGIGPACVAPIASAATNITPNAANANWTPTTGNFIIEYGPTATFGTPGTGATAGNPNNNVVTASNVGTVQLTGLTANTGYSYVVRKDCGVDGFSLNSNTITFTTQAITTIPWTEDFPTTTTPTGWNITGWIIGTTTELNPGSTNYIRKNLYSGATTGAFATINMGAVTAGSKLKFDYKLANFNSPYGPPASGSGNFVVEVSSDYGLTYSALATVVNNAVAGWQNLEYDLTSFVGQDIKVRMTGNWVSGDYYLAFDNFFVGVPPTCLAPVASNATNITSTSANANWTPTTGDFIIEYGPTATFGTPGTGATPGNPNNFVVTASNVGTIQLTGLTPVTGYTYVVRLDCGVDGYSLNSSSINFVTAYECSIATVLTCGQSTTTGNLAVSGGIYNQISTSCGFTTSGLEKLFSFTSTSAGVYTLNVTGVNGGTGYIDYFFKEGGVDCSSTGWTCINDINSVSSTNTITLLANTQYTLLLDAESASGTANHTFQIDCPLPCPAPISAAATGITSTTAFANWTPTTGNFIIEYGPTATFGTPGTGSTPGNPNNFVVTASNVGTIQLTGLTPVTGYSYVVRLDCTGAGNGYSANSTVRTFTTLDAPPANDEATGAIALTVGAGCTGTPYTSVNATRSANEPVGTCHNNYTTSSHPGVWFSFAAPPSGAVKVSTDVGGAGTLTDTRVSLFSASDASNYATFTLIACDEDNGNTVGGNKSILYAVDLIPSTIYYVLVHGFFPTTTGTFCLAVDELSSTLVSDVTNCGTTIQSIFGTNTTYLGTTSIVDNNGKLVAIVKNSGTGSSPSSFVGRQNINAGPVRQDPHGSYYLDRNHRITNTTAGPYEVVLPFLDTELAALNAVQPTTLSQIIINRQTGETACTADFNSANGTESIINQTSSASANGVSYVKFTTPGFSNFYFSNVSTPLPVTIISFDGVLNKSGHVNLNWKVANEVQIRDYVVERSIDGQKFESIGSVNALNKASYGLVDLKPANGVNYYRLAITGLDGQVQYSQTITVHVNGTRSIAVYPNPTSSEVQLEVSGAVQGTAVVTLTDFSGKELQTIKTESNKVTIDLNAYPAGTYIVKYKDGSYSTTSKITKL